MIYDLDKLEIKILHRKKFYDGVTFEYNGKIFYYKKVKNIRNHYNELIAEKIAKKLNIPCCHYHIAYFDDEIGVVTELFDKTNFISMNDYLSKKYKDEDSSHTNNLENIWDAFLTDFDSETAEKLMSQLVNIFIFDCLIGNIDRHTENYGLIINKEEVNFAPLYDNENMLSDDSIYFGDYCLGIESGDYKNNLSLDEYPENLLYKFLDMSADFYKDQLKEKLEIISEENLNQIFKELEEEGIVINQLIKLDILKRFDQNRYMINNYFASKKK